MICKISIIIPTHNCEKYIKRCLESCINQTLSEIEVVCIDNNSKDKTVEILMNYQNKDDRIKVICLDKDSGALVARKRGVEVANGEYILFLDAADCLDLEACSLLYKKIKSKKVEILNFTTKLISSDEINLNQRLMKPYKLYLKNEEVFNKFFIEEKYSWDLYNKLFSTKLCKEAFLHIEDKYISKSEDLYIFFIIAYFAKSYYGWKAKKQYIIYNIENNHNEKIDTSIEFFKQYCYQHKVINGIEEFAKQENILDKVKERIYKYKEKFIKESINIWLSLNKNDYGKATNILFECWGIENVLSILANNFDNKKGYIAQKIYDADLFPIKKKANKVIGIYYYKLNMGGIQRVISLIIPKLVKLGYKVVLITDEEPAENDYIIDCEYTREIIGAKKYVERLNLLKKIIEKHSIDLMLYHAWLYKFLLWDMIYLQSQNIPVIIHTHLIFTYALNMYRNADQVYTLALSNGIIVLSEADKNFWSLFNKNTKFIHNPIDLKLKNVERANCNEKIIIWSGRLTEGKQLNEALKVLQVAIKYDSDIKMWVFGDGATKSVIKKYKEKAKKMKIDNNIVFWGYQKNIYKFYLKSSVNLITSKVEGYPMTLIEAKAHGIPTVMYNLPYLYLASEDKGTISVEQGDYLSAAKEIVMLLNNKEKWTTFSDLSYSTIKNMFNIDYATELLSVINNINNMKVEPTVEKLMLETTITNCIERGNKKDKNIIKRIVDFKKMFGIRNLIKKFLKKIKLYLK